MTVHVAFFKARRGSIKHRVIGWITRSEYSHCEVVVRGRGYAPTAGKKTLHVQQSHPPSDWKLVKVPWDEQQAVEYITQNWETAYDWGAVGTYLLPFIRHHVLAQNCSEFTVNLGSYCGDPRFHGRPASRCSPQTIYRLLSKRSADKALITK